MAAVLPFQRICHSTVFRPFILYNRMISTCQHVRAGQKWRISQGQAPDGIRYGPLTDRPDWSYADGRPAPETVRRRKRMQNRLDVAQRVSQLLTEIDEAKDTTEQKSSKTQEKSKVQEK